jgi:hypothetical protein
VWSDGDNDFPRFGYKNKRLAGVYLEKRVPFLSQKWDRDCHFAAGQALRPTNERKSGRYENCQQIFVLSGLDDWKASDLFQFED